MKSSVKRATKLKSKEAPASAKAGATMAPKGTARANVKETTSVKLTSPAKLIAVAPAKLLAAAPARLKSTAMKALSNDGAELTVKTAEEALALIRKHGVVTLAARIEGVPCFVEAVAGERIAGSWWGHPKGKLIFALAEGLKDSDDVLSLKLLEGKATFLAREHTEKGRHEKRLTSWSDWAKARGVSPAKVSAEAARDGLRNRCGGKPTELDSAHSARGRGGC